MSADLVAKLFQYRKKVVFDEIELWMRIPGDQTVEEARVSALLASRKLRKNLRNPESDEYLLYIDPVEDFTDEEIFNACANLAYRDVMRDYVNSTPKPPLPEIGDHPSQEELEELVAAREQRDIDYAEAMRAFLETWREQYIAGLKRGTVERAKTIYKKLKTDRVCEDKFSDVFEETLLVSALFTDEACTIPAITRDEFKNVPQRFKQFVRDEFQSMNLTGEELKK